MGGEDGGLNSCGRDGSLYIQSGGVVHCSIVAPEFRECGNAESGDGGIDKTLYRARGFSISGTNSGA